MSSADAPVSALPKRSLAPVAYVIIFTVMIVVAGVDQLTKYVVVHHFSQGVPLEIVPGFLGLTLTYNQGAAFGLLADLPDSYRGLALGATTILALLAVGFLLFRDYYNHRPGQIALAMILGGALGNIIDRVRLGMVVDFIDAYYENYHWPAFNIADSCICVGVFCLLFMRPQKMPS